MIKKEQILKSLKIGKNDLVLEIGGGDSPSWRSDILIDRYLLDDKERAGSLVIDRPFICADAHSIPIKDKTIDYIYCSQILEHLERPEAFFSEITRVGKRGFIETPNEFRERLICRSFHRWVISEEDKVLVLRKNHLPPIFGSLFQSLMRTPEFFHFYRTYYSLFNIMYEWEQEIHYRIEGPAEFDQEDPSGWIDTLDTILKDFDRSKIWPFSKHAMFKTSLQLFFNVIRSYLNRKVRKQRKKIKTNRGELFSELLCCPCCKFSLDMQWDLRKIECTHCSRIYPIIEEIPILLLDEKEVEEIKERWKRQSA